jgi:hypothetical protein
VTDENQIPAGEEPIDEWTDTGPPYVEITQIGRWTYDINISDGLMCWDGWPRPAYGSRKHAEKKARRCLAKYMRERGREPIGRFYE